MFRTSFHLKIQYKIVIDLFDVLFAIITLETFRNYRCVYIKGWQNYNFFESGEMSISMIYSYTGRRDIVKDTHNKVVNIPGRGAID